MKLFDMTFWHVLFLKSMEQAQELSYTEFNLKLQHFQLIYANNSN